MAVLYYRDPVTGNPVPLFGGGSSTSVGGSGLQVATLSFPGQSGIRTRNRLWMVPTRVRLNEARVVWDPNYGSVDFVIDLSYDGTPWVTLNSWDATVLDNGYKVLEYQQPTDTYLYVYYGSVLETKSTVYYSTGTSIDPDVTVEWWMFEA